MMTLRDMIIRVAQAVGVASYGSGNDNTAGVPSDPNTLALVIQAINDGRAAFYAESSKLSPSVEPGVWQFMRPVYELTLSPDGTGPFNIGGDSARYRMPQHLAGPSTNTVVCRGAGGGSRPLVTSMDRVRASHAASPSSRGIPSMIAFGHLAPAPGDVGTPLELRVFPSPSEAFVLEVPMRLAWVELRDLQEVEPSPYPHAVIAFAVYQLVQHANVPSGPDVASADKTRAEWLSRARSMETTLSPRTTGILQAPDQDLQPSRPYVGMTSAYGYPIGVSS